MTNLPTIKMYRVAGPHTFELTVPVFTPVADLSEVDIYVKVVSSTDWGYRAKTTIRVTGAEDLTYGDGSWMWNLLGTGYATANGGLGALFRGLSAWAGVRQMKIVLDEDGTPPVTVLLPDDYPKDTDLWADFSVPLYLDASVDTVMPGSGEGEGTVEGDPIGVDIDGDGEPDYQTVVTPLDPDIPDPAAPPGSGYSVGVTKPGGGGGALVVGYLPAGALPNDPLYLRVDGRFLAVLYDGQVIVTYLIPASNYNLNVSEFWIGYVDSEGHMGGPAPVIRPPLGGFAYALDTGFWEIVYTRQLGPVKNRYSETIWERGDGSLAASRIPFDPDLHDPATKWWVTNGHVVPITNGLAVRIWEAGLSRFLTPIP